MDVRVVEDLAEVPAAPALAVDVREQPLLAKGLAPKEEVRRAFEQIRASHRTPRVARGCLLERWRRERGPHSPQQPSQHVGWHGRLEREAPILTLAESQLPLAAATPRRPIGRAAVAREQSVRVRCLARSRTDVRTGLLCIGLTAIGSTAYALLEELQC